MVLSYEEALSTLESMFSESAWTRESLDAVLRHQKGHMENTVDFILRHTGKDPQTIMEQLQAGIDPDESTIRMDAELARQLAQSTTVTAGESGARGTPTRLPDDFLRIPGYNPAHFVSETDEELARRLQQEENQQEESARRTPATNAAARRAAAARPQQRTAAPPIGPVLQQNLQTVQKHLNELGENVTSQFRMITSRFNKNAASQQHPDDVTPAAERRGLLEDEEELEFARR